MGVSDLGRVLETFPNWKVRAMREETPRLTRAARALESR